MLINLVLIKKPSLFSYFFPNLFLLIVYLFQIDRRQGRKGGEAKAKYTFFFYKHRVYKHIRLRFTEILSTLLSTLQPEIWLESNFTRKIFNSRRRGLIFMQILIFLSYFYQMLYIKYFVLFIFYKYAF